MGIRREPDGLYVGSVAWLTPLAAATLSPVHEPLAALLRRLIEPLPLYHGVAPSFDDAAWVGGRLIELLPLPLALKQSLLEMPDPESSGSSGSPRRSIRPRARARRRLVIRLPAENHRAFGGQVT